MTVRPPLKILLFCLFALTVWLLPLPALTGVEAGVPVYVIPVAGEVDPGLAAFIARALADIAAAHDAADSPPEKILYVFELDTFGGRVDSALQIVDTILAVDSGTTIAFVKGKAISAGALIALSCNQLAMRPSTTIGDVAPITYTSEGVEMMGEKFQSPLRAKFRTLARRNGYPPALAEAMVTADLEILRVEMVDGRTLYMDGRDFAELSEEEQGNVVSSKTVVAKGELLTMDDVEARELGFSTMTADSLEEMLDRLEIAPYRVQRMALNWSEVAGRFVGSIAPILLMIGLAALYMEMKAPGFGLPGLVGIVCLGLVFLNQYMVGLAEYTELLLIVLGLVLLAFEVFVLPGFGIAGIGGFILIGIGMILAFQDFVVPDPAMPWQQELLVKNIARVVASWMVAILAGLLFLRYLFPRLGRVVEGPYLSATLWESRAASRDATSVRVGDAGVTVTHLRPAGKVRLGETVVDVISQGEFVEPGREVTVAEIKGNRVVVTPRPLANDT